MQVEWEASAIAQEGGDGSLEQSGGRGGDGEKGSDFYKFCCAARVY